MYHYLFRLNRLYDKARIKWDDLEFTDIDLKKLLIPLMIENLLTSFMGMADSMMVTRVGSEAISAVSLTDSLNTLVIQMFSAIATGGTIICSQYLGSKNNQKANSAAQQIILSVLVISLTVSFFSEMFNAGILRLIFGQVDEAVMTNSETYFRLTAASFPFIGLYQVGAAFYRAGGNSKFPMKISVISNLFNIIGNFTFIFIFRWGVFGAALSTLMSRIFSAVVIMISLRRPSQPIVIRHYLIKPDIEMIKRVLFIGIPSGIENSMFQFGKLAIQSSVSTLGTTAIAAQAMTIIFENVNGIAAIAVGMGLMTVTGQTLGAGKTEEAKYYIVKHMRIGDYVIIASCLMTFALCKPVMWLAGMEQESAAMCFNMMIYITVVKCLIWVPSFIIPYGLRSAGDVSYTMMVSSLSMWLTRVALTTVLIRFMGFGPIAVWYGMSLDWLVRGLFYIHRFMGTKWLRHQLI
ncbi:MATE family efflux transporter [Oribacterium sp. WCC10]|uniref:MATE family efflux transporter n=1 Tax=Oribacterium sp. WCC10 TaxID=1855343 RepID=UPI0008F13A5B|nr:MATE family efflux transporter [Oribacterium sp. WCC10]SFG61847.1 putative efflux protein, MATE family [Oribacterium sp. WCC10]